MTDEIESIKRFIGESITKNYGQDDYANLIWGGDSVTYGSPSYDGIVIPLTKGVNYTINNGIDNDGILTIMLFSSMPTYGMTAESGVNSPFTAQDD